MHVRFHRKFRKKYKKLRITEQKKFDERLEIFVGNPFSRILDNHPLHGEWWGYRSIDVAGDLRAVFKIIDEDLALFVDIDTHSELYS